MTAWLHADLCCISSPSLLRMNHCRCLLLRKCSNSGRLWGEVWQVGLWSNEGWVDIVLSRSHWWIVQVWGLTYWPKAAKEQVLFYFVLFVTSIPSWSLKHFLMFFADLLPRLCGVGLLLSPHFIQSGTLPHTLSSPSLLVATGAGFNHPVFCVCCRKLSGLWLAPVLLPALKLLIALISKFAFQVSCGVFMTHRWLINSFFFSLHKLGLHHCRWATQ